MFKRIKVLLLAAVIGGFCLEAGERLSIPGVHEFHLHRASCRRPSSDPDERRGRRPEDGPPLRRGCLFLLVGLG